MPFLKNKKNKQPTLLARPRPRRMVAPHAATEGGEAASGERRR